MNEDNFEVQERESCNTEDEDEYGADARVDVTLKQGTILNEELLRIKQLRKTGKYLRLHLERHYHFNHLDIKQFLVNVIKALPNLKKLLIVTKDASFTSHPVHICEFDAKFIVAMLRQLARSSKISAIRFCFVEIKGQYQDFQSWGAALRSLKTLEKLNLDKISIEEQAGGKNPTHPGCWLDPLARAAAQLPQLRHLRILGTRDFEKKTNGRGSKAVALQTTTLRQLCKTKTLLSLCLIHFNLDDDNVAQMAQELETNEKLKELDIDCTLDLDGTSAVTHLLERNRVLEDLNLCIRCRADEITDEPIFNMVNTTRESSAAAKLKEELLVTEDKINMQLVEGVGRSRLVNFALFRGRISSRVQDAFREMIAKQLTLESLTLYTGDHAMNEALSKDSLIKFYCKLNYFGRKQVILGEPPLLRWKTKPAPASKKRRGKRDKSPYPRAPAFRPERGMVDTLGRVSKDVGCLFYLLKTNPAICDLALQKMQKNEHQLTVKKKRSRQEPKKKWPKKPHAKKRRQSEDSESSPPVKRTRLYRAAKYRGVSYKC